MKFTRDEIRASMLLYAVTDRAWLGGRTLPDWQTVPPSSRCGRRGWITTPFWRRPKS